MADEFTYANVRRAVTGIAQYVTSVKPRALASSSDATRGFSARAPSTCSQFSATTEYSRC